MLRKNLYTNFSQIEVYIVDGKYVRENMEIGFTHGGNPEVYDFIPEREIWIDSDLSRDEIIPTVLHEAIEYKLISNGINYDKAHDTANKIELFYRKLGNYGMMKNKIREICKEI